MGRENELLIFKNREIKMTKDIFKTLKEDDCKWCEHFFTEQSCRHSRPHPLSDRPSLYCPYRTIKGLMETLFDLIYSVESFTDPETHEIQASRSKVLANFVLNNGHLPVNLED